MATKIVDEQPAVPVKAGASGIDEVMVCRLLAAMNEKWGPVAEAKPKLALIQGGKGRVS